MARYEHDRVVGWGIEQGDKFLCGRKVKWGGGEEYVVLGWFGRGCGVVKSGSDTREGNGEEGANKFMVGRLGTTRKLSIGGD